MKKILAIAILALLPQVSFAATSAIEAEVGKSVINAVEGTLILPEGVVPTKILTGDSAILIWVTKPEYDPKSRSIIFAGLTPGGWSGRRALFAIESDLASLDAAQVIDGKAYLNDGNGSLSPVVFGFSTKEVVDDTEKPEPFTINTAVSEESFEGNHFISFVAQDKNTGVERYEFASTWLLPPSESDWIVTESPRALSSLEKFQRIHVRAVDWSGNVRLVSTGGPYWFITLAFWLIMFTCIASLIRRSLSLRS